jgi:hypothetical protein
MRRPGDACERGNQCGACEPRGYGRCGGSGSVSARGLGSRPARVRTAFRAPRVRTAASGRQTAVHKAAERKPAWFAGTGPAAGERTSGRATGLSRSWLWDPGQSAPRISGLWRSWLSRSRLSRRGVCRQGLCGPGQLSSGASWRLAQSASQSSGTGSGADAAQRSWI